MPLPFSINLIGDDVSQIVEAEVGERQRLAVVNVVDPEARLQSGQARSQLPTSHSRNTHRQRPADFNAPLRKSGLAVVGIC